MRTKKSIKANNTSFKGHAILLGSALLTSGISVLLYLENQALFFCFLVVFTAFSWVIHRRRRSYFSHSLVFACFFSALYLLFGSRTAERQPIAVVAITGIIIVASLVFTIDRKRGYVAEMMSRHSGGIFVRRTFVALAVVMLGVVMSRKLISVFPWLPVDVETIAGILLLMFMMVILDAARAVNKKSQYLKTALEEKLKAEAEIRNHILFLETVVENIPNMIFVKKGVELRFAAINKAGEQLLGIPRKDYIGKTDDDVFPADQAEFFKQKDLEVYKNDSVVVIDAEKVLTKEGERWLRTKKIPIKDEHGIPLYIVGISEDITEKRAQDEKIRHFYAELEKKVEERTEELSNSEKRFRALLENSTDAITIARASSEIIYQSPAVERITGYSVEESLGTSLPELLHPEDADMFGSLMNELKMKPGIPLSRQCRIIHKSGKTVWVEGTATNLLQDESVKAMVFNYRDITDRKKNEQERELLIQGLTRHNADLRQFSYITSHNLRAPLSNLLGLLGLIKNIPISDPDLIEILDGFNTSTNSLNDTINDLLKILYIKEHTAVEQEEVNLSELFEKILAQVSNLIEQAQPDLDVSIMPEGIIHFNRSYLESIFLNLLTNAIKYRSEKRKLKITVRMEDYESKTVITFEDNGIGLDMERCRDKVFGLYQRFHNHKDSKGLGLYLVKTQIEALGGKIAIDSAVDEGTKFTLIFNKLYAEQNFLH